MRDSLARLAPIVILGAIAGCATSAPPPTPVTPPVIPVSYDGTAQGSIQLTSSGVGGGQTSWCDTPPVLSLSLQKGAFNYILAHPNVPKNSSYSMSPNFTVVVAADGSFNATSQNGEAQMSGRIVGSHLTGRIDGTACGYVFTAEKT